MSRTLKLIFIAFGWLSGLVASLCTIGLFLFGVRMLFVGDVADGLKVIGVSLVLGWVLGVVKSFLERSWARIPIRVINRADSS
jgi:hypothetical protein